MNRECFSEVSPSAPCSQVLLRSTSSTSRIGAHRGAVSTARPRLALVAFVFRGVHKVTQESLESMGKESQRAGKRFRGQQKKLLISVIAYTAYLRGGPSPLTPAVTPWLSPRADSRAGSLSGTLLTQNMVLRNATLVPRADSRVGSLSGTLLSQTMVLRKATLVPRFEKPHLSRVRIPAASEGARVRYTLNCPGVLSGVDFRSTCRINNNSKEIKINRIYFISFAINLINFRSGVRYGEACRSQLE